MCFSKIEISAEIYLKQAVYHPFNQALFMGTLSEEKFKNFLAQDAFYLLHYGKTLTRIADKLVNPKHKTAFLDFANDTVMAEQEIHQKYVSEKPAVICPAIINYLTHLENYSEHPHVGVTIASVLPCFWLYRELGKYMAITQIDQTHPYKQWVETYANPEFYHATEVAIHIMQEISSPEVEAEMMSVFLTSAHHEINFFTDMLMQKSCEPVQHHSPQKLSHAWDL